MALKSYKPVTPSRRYYSTYDFAELGELEGAKVSRPKALFFGKGKSGGRNNYGRNTNINIGGGHKRLMRVVDFKRNKIDVPAKVVAIDYDPNRSARIALLQYADGEKRYILAPNGLSLGTTVMSGPNAEVKVGNCLPLSAIPTGEPVHNIELKPGAGGQLVRSAGLSAQVVAKEGEYVMIRLPSGELRKILGRCSATLGVLGNAEHQNLDIGKAGRSRWLGRRPHNRAVTKNPVDHPMGGGQGKTSGGRHPCSPSGLKAKGLKTRRNKRTQKFIVRGRKDRTTVG
jgi:large subunit ribosomal protein L2